MPLRELLNKKNEWAWGEPQRQAFEDVKQALVMSPVLSLFDQNCDTIVSADASSHGLGAVLFQKQLGREWKPVSYISRSLTPTERRYAQIEKEALAFIWACERFSDYLLDFNFLSHRNRSQAISSAIQFEEFGGTSHTSATISTTNDTIQFHHLTCSRENC